MNEYIGREHIDGILEEAGMKEQALIVSGNKHLADSRAMILLAREIRLLRALLAAREERIKALEGVAIDAQEAFVELWGVASGADQRFTDDTEALEWVDRFAQKHDKKLQAALSAPPAEAPKEPCSCGKVHKKLNCDHGDFKAHDCEVCFPPDCGHGFTISQMERGDCVECASVASESAPTPAAQGEKCGHNLVWSPEGCWCPECPLVGYPSKPPIRPCQCIGEGIHAAPPKRDGGKPD